MIVKSIVEYLLFSSRKYENKAAFIDEDKSITYGELYDLSKRIATSILNMDNLMNARMPIAVFMDKGCDALVCFMGIAMSGNIYAPIDCEAPIERIRKIMETLRPRMIVCDKKNYDIAKKCFKGNVEIFLYDTMPADVIDENAIELCIKNICDVDPLYVLFTSGSTGVPKGVLISHRSVIDFTEEASEVMSFSSEERFCNQAPFYFDASVPDIYCTIRNGATLYIPSSSYYQFPIKILKYIQKNKISAFFWVPSALVVVANFRVLGKVNIDCVKKVMFCGEVMPTKQYNVWKKCLPEAVFVNYYGPCETTYACTYYVIDRDFKDDEALPIGKPALNTKAVILNDDREVTEKGVIGELCIAGSCLSLGYYNNVEKTKESFVQNPLENRYPEIIYRTGDLVMLNDYGEIMYITRKDFQIKHMGYRIELGEIETVVSAVVGVELACCLYDLKKQQICLFYQGTIEKDEVMQKIQLKLPNYMLPQRIEHMAVMLMNANGKIDRIRIRKEYLDNGNE